MPMSRTRPNPWNDGLFYRGYILGLLNGYPTGMAVTMVINHLEYEWGAKSDDTCRWLRELVAEGFARTDKWGDWVSPIYQEKPADGDV